MEPFVKPSNSAASASSHLDTLFGSQGAQAETEAPVETQAPETPSHEASPVSEDQAQVEAQAESPDEAGQEAQAQAEDWLEFNVTDGEGRKRVKVNLADRDQLQRILAQGYGFRKMQAERDQALKSAKTAEPRLKELEESWGALSQAYDNAGVEGVIDLLGGKAGHFKEWKQKEFERELKFQTASESEKSRIILEEKLAKLERESALREKRAQEDKAKAAQDREAATLKSVEAQVAPAFQKVRFAGTLGDAAVEQAYDQAIWDQALKNLEAIPENVPMTQKVVEAEFTRIANAFRKVIGEQANTKAKAVIESKKQAAQSQLAAKVTKNVGPKSNTADMQKHVERGGISGLTDGLMSILNRR